MSKRKGRPIRLTIEGDTDEERQVVRFEIRTRDGWRYVQCYAFSQRTVGNDPRWARLEITERLAQPAAWVS